jgi:glutathione S-transferase
VITLIQFPKPPGRASFSPFCLKMETYLKVAQVPYENKLTVSMSGSRKKKLPMILDQGELIEDSTLIIEHLNKKHGIDLDKNLTPEQKAVAKAFQWLCEKSLIDIIVHFRWVDPVNWPHFREVVFYGAPWLIKVTVANVMAKSIKKTLYKHGLGRFTDEEKLKILDDNLSAIAVYLGDKKYFFGDHVSAIDTILYAFLVQVHPRGVVRQLEGVRSKYPNLDQYVERFTKTYWPEFQAQG